MRSGFALLSVFALLLPGVARAADVAPGPPDADGPARVLAGVFLSDVNAVTEEDETFEFEAILTLRWRDPRLSFDPSAAGASEKIYQGAYQFAEVFRRGSYPAGCSTTARTKRTAQEPGRPSLLLDSNR
jgi:hypothetical protein